MMKQADGDQTIMRAEVLRGLSGSPRRLPCKYLYDREGSALFEEICGTDAYYITRTETEILSRHAAQIADALRPTQVLVEFGSGSGKKTRVILGALQGLRAYMPVEINAEVLQTSVRQLRAEFPRLQYRPVAADYTRPLDLPIQADQPMTVFFPGSTLGNFARPKAQHFLAQLTAALPAGSGMLVGVDTKKDPAVLTRAYNDPQGITAAFNLNILARLNRDLDADFDLAGFRHHAYYNPVDGRIESYLVSLTRQTVRIGDERFRFARGEPIHTEYSCKYSVEEFCALARQAGFEPREVWTDAREWFAVYHLRVN